MKISVVLYFQALEGIVLASSTFQTQCSIPLEPANFVLAANVRGTLDILWTSLFTLLTCCWTVQHLNIPRQQLRASRPPKGQKIAWRERAIRALRVAQYNLFGVLPKCKWMLLTLFMPEFLVGKALQDRRLAQKFISDIKDLPKEKCKGLEWAKENWTLTHGFYIGMGGFAIKATCNTGLKTAETPIFLNTLSFLYVCGVRKDINSTASEREREANSPETPVLIEEVPRITEEEIKDKSKSDFFIKTITIGQLAWFIIQAIARGVRGLAIPQLEIAVLAYAACTIITFILCLSKPKDVHVPTLLFAGASTRNQLLTESSNEPQPQVLATRDRGELARLHPASWFWITLRSHRFFRAKIEPDRTKTILSPIPNDARYSHEPAMSILFPGQALLTHMDDGFILAGMIFGGIHCASWYSAFPTPVEQLLWRVASIFTAGLLPVYYTILLIDIHRGWMPGFGQILPFFEFCAVLGYILARLYLVVEIFRSLCFQPPSAFIATWSSEIPHVA